jgi:hypothetical protein
MKKRTIAILLLVVVLGVTGMLTGCYKTTGGGSFTADETSSAGLPGHFCTFGFNAQPVNQPYPGYEATFIYAKGNFEFHDHTAKTSIKGDFSATWAITNATSSQFAGLCTINKQGPYAFAATFTDNGPGQQDYVSLMVVNSSSLADLILPPLYQYDGTLDPGSDIVVHAP